MALAEYERLAARAFDEPHDPELREAVRVCADALEQASDPRGPLITMEHALADLDDGAQAANPERRAVELRRAMREHVVAHGAALLGGVASLMSYKRALELEWRAGRIYGASIDARYITKKAHVSPADLVKLFLKGPAAKHLRRLRVRVRSQVDALAILTALGKRKQPPPLEEIEIGRRVWPLGMGVYSPNAIYTKIREKYPNLWFFAVDDEILALETATKTQSEVLLLDDPTTLAPRVELGRALCQADPLFRGAALARIIELGASARVYARILAILLQPRVVGRQVAVVPALAAAGAPRFAMTALAKIASRRQYDLETRKLAGKVAAALRGKVTA